MDLGLGFDQAAIGMALVGLDGRFLRVNRALCDLLGRSEAELLDRTIADLAEPGDDPVLANLGRAAAAEGAQASFQVERSCRRADGARLDLLISAALLHGPDGRQTTREHTIRLYALTELEAMLGRAGLELLAVHGDLDGGPLELDSSFLVTLSGRAGKGIS